MFNHFLFLFYIIFQVDVSFADVQEGKGVRNKEHRLEVITLRILNWENYLAPEVIEIWQQRTGVEIEQIFFDNDEDRDEIILNGDTQNIDIAVIDESASRVFGQSRHIYALNTSNVKGIDNLAANWRAHCGDYSIPYLWGTMGIAYRSDKIASPPMSWNDLISPVEELKGHIGMLDDYVDTLAPVLLLEGESISTDDSAILKHVFDRLVEQMPNVLTYEYAISFLQADSKADELYMALVYSGDEVSLEDASGNFNRWKYVVPDEGTILWVDCLAVLSSSKQKQLAQQFIEFINEPKIAAIYTRSAAIS